MSEKKAIRPNGIAMPSPREDVEQICLLRWAAMEKGAHPELDMLIHIPNEGQRSKLTGARLRMMGLKKGVPDMILPIARGGYHGLWIELKRKDKSVSRVSPEQRGWIAALRVQGYAAQVCYGWEDAAEYIMGYLRMGGKNDEMPGMREDI